jgi:hypothetical protein
MKQIKDFRNRQPRLTLGLGDQQSIAEAFSEEAANIGSNVSGRALLYRCLFDIG